MKTWDGVEESFQKRLTYERGNTSPRQGDSLSYRTLYELVHLLIVKPLLAKNGYSNT